MKSEKVSIVFIEDHEPWIGTVALAKGFGVNHRDITNKIKKYESEFLELSENRDAFKMRLVPRKNGGPEFEEYILNEVQATYATTLLQNNDKVRKFKMWLSKEFNRQRKHINDLIIAIRSNKANAEWLEARASGKPIRREETDVLKKLAEYQMRCGSKNSGMVYVTYSKMVNQALFGNEVKKVKGKNLRNFVDVSSLNILKVSDDMVARLVDLELQKETEYHQIYKICKEKMERFADFMGKRQIALVQQQAIA